jgi:transcriptional regulator with XRE-family HTH domain
MALAPLVAERGKKVELARSLKVDQSMVTRWVSGERTPPAGSRLELQERFGIDWRLWDEEVEVDDEPVSDPHDEVLPDPDPDPEATEDTATRSKAGASRAGAL